MNKARIRTSKRPKGFKGIGITCLLIVLSTSPTKLFAQETYEAWKSSYLKEYDAFKDSLASKYLELIKESWDHINPSQPDYSFRPKPDVQPVFSPVLDHPKKEEKKTVVVVPNENIERPLPKAKQSSFTLEPAEKETANNSNRHQTISMFGLQFTMPWFQKETLDLGRKKAQEQIVTFLEWVEKNDQTQVLNELKNYYLKYDKDDWILASQLKFYASNRFDDKESQKLYIWFLMNKLGYDVRIAHSRKGFVLLSRFSTPLYNRVYYRIKGEKYYIILDKEQEHSDGLSVQYPEAVYTKGNRDIFLKSLLENNGLFKGTYTLKQLKFSYKGQKYSFEIPIQRERIRYYEDYPQTDQSVYLAADVDHQVKFAMGRFFKPHLDSLDNITERINFLLAFSQSAFVYATDKDNLGYEKYCMPEETLFYSKSDCEDRTAILSWLVRNYLNLEVVGLRYPNHICLGISIPNSDLNDEITSGASFIVNGATYYSADPTYLNATLGMQMPKFKNTSPTIILVNNNN